MISFTFLLFSSCFSGEDDVPAEGDAHAGQNSVDFVKMLKEGTLLDEEGNFMVGKEKRVDAAVEIVRRILRGILEADDPLDELSHAGTETGYERLATAMDRLPAAEREEIAARVLQLGRRDPGIGRLYLDGPDRWAGSLCKVFLALDIPLRKAEFTRSVHAGQADANSVQERQEPVSGHHEMIYPFVDVPLEFLTRFS